MICGRTNKSNVNVFFNKTAQKFRFVIIGQLLQKNILKIELVNVRVMNVLQAKFYSIPIGIENFTASAHITYYAHITPSYPI